MADIPADFDVLIVGAGLSGIGMAAHLQMKCPGRRFTILERRDTLGGTWDLFRYPGVRSDSDMHTLGFEFEPWRHEKSIADGASILDYLHRIADERGIREQIRFGHKVIAADFDSARACWTVTVEVADGERRRLTANWLYLGSGYYDYDEPFDPGFDLGAFKGKVIHPQFWPDDLDYAGKQVVVIGSGATAVTLVPSMASTAAHVTMLQRTPTWMFSRPAKDSIANFLRRWLPEKLAYRLTRWKNITMGDKGFKRAREKPEKVASFLHDRLRKILGDRFDPATFTPPLQPLGPADLPGPRRRSVRSAEGRQCRYRDRPYCRVRTGRGAPGRWPPTACGYPGDGDRAEAGRGWQDRDQRGRRARQLRRAFLLQGLHVLQHPQFRGGVRLSQRQLDAARRPQFRLRVPRAEHAGGPGQRHRGAGAPDGPRAGRRRRLRFLVRVHPALQAYHAP